MLKIRLPIKEGEAGANAHHVGNLAHFILAFLLVCKKVMEHLGRAKPQGANLFYRNKGNIQPDARNYPTQLQGGWRVAGANVNSLG